jgi:hypothetical protein
MKLKHGDEKSPDTPETQKWGGGSAIVSFSNNGPNNNPEIQINVPQNSTTVADNDGSILEHISKYLKQVARIFYRFLFYMICILLVLTGLFLLYLMIVALMEQMGVNLDALPV